MLEQIQDPPQPDAKPFWTSGYPAVGRRVQTFREEKGWSRTDLAERARLAPSTIAMVERGARIPSLKTARRLGEAFDLDPVRFFPCEVEDVYADYTDAPAHIKDAVDAVRSAWSWHREAVHRLDPWMENEDEAGGEFWAVWPPLPLRHGGRRRSDLSPDSRALLLQERALHRALVRLYWALKPHPPFPTEPE